MADWPRIFSTRFLSVQNEQSTIRQLLTPENSATLAWSEELTGLPTEEID
jgi:hypothetical protein